MMYLGDFIEDDVNLTFFWNTNDANGASITRATDGTVKVIRDDGTDCTGTSVTDSEDSPDVGIHKCVIDLSDSDNYAIGHDYAVWLDGAVIDGQTVNAALACFSIQNRYLFDSGASRVRPVGNLGDYKNDAIINFTWCTNAANGSSANPTTVGTIKVYKNDGAVEVTVPTGITDTRGFDGVTGVHLCTIDLSASSFYDTENDYSIVLVGAVVDSQTVNVVLGTFSVEMRYQGVKFEKD